MVVFMSAFEKQGKKMEFNLTKIVDRALARLEPVSRRLLPKEPRKEVRPLYD